MYFMYVVHELVCVLQAHKVKDYPNEVKFEEEAKRLNRPLFVPPWFTVDLKVGVCYFACKISVPQSPAC